MAGTLCVACKIPNGLIVQVYGSEEYSEPVMGGGWRKGQRAFKKGPAIKLNGSAHARNQMPTHDIHFGAGLTYGVDADIFNAWMEQNKDSDFVKQKLVFAATKPIEVDAQAKDQISVKTGLEPLDPNNLPDEFKRKVTTADVV